ncbi:hypothetical protein LCGC14_0437970 [marine sediment metagenome]|uniref:Uncharacterized protein n=1 Tax=marine sediment metagenome TaxID=412755 RepID=A0A0F9T4C7_9ZZZZ
MGMKYNLVSLMRAGAEALDQANNDGGRAIYCFHSIIYETIMHLLRQNFLDRGLVSVCLLRAVQVLSR